MNNLFTKTLLCFIVAAPHSLSASYRSIDKLKLTNSTDHRIRNIKVLFTFIGETTASEQHHLEGKFFIKQLNPGKSITVDPRQAKHVGVIGTVYEHFDNPRILIRRIDSSTARRGFTKPGTDSHNDLEFVTHNEKDVIRSSQD